MKNKFIPKFILGSVCLLAVTSTAYATDTVKDVTPPFGKLVIEGATEVNNVNYVTRDEVTLRIYAKDDTCADDEIKYYISTSPIDKTARLSNDVWKNYATGMTETVTLPDTTGKNVFYLVLKDKYDNISTIFSGGNTEYTIKFDANGTGATETPADQVGYFGMALNLTSNVPKCDGHYFLGWSTNPNATVATYEQGALIPASVFGNSTTSPITLYAVWTTTTDRTTITCRQSTNWRLC